MHKNARPFPSSGILQYELRAYTHACMGSVAQAHRQGGTCVGGVYVASYTPLGLFITHVLNKEFSPWEEGVVTESPKQRPHHRHTIISTPPF